MRNSLHRNQLFTFLAIGAADVRRGVAEEIGHLHARHRHRPLKRHEDAGPRPLVRLHRQQIDHGAVVADQFDAACGHFVARMAHDGQAERRFAGAVRAHQGMHFAATDFEIHASKNRLAADGHVQISDLQRFGHFRNHCFQSVFAAASTASGIRENSDALRLRSPLLLSSRELSAWIQAPNP